MEPGGSSYCDSSYSQQLRSAWKLILGSSLESSLRAQSGRGKKRGVLQQMGFDLNIYSITSGLSWFPAKGVILLPTLAFTSSHFSPCARQNLDFLSFLLLVVQVPWSWLGFLAFLSPGVDLYAGLSQTNSIVFPSFCFFHSPPLGSPENHRLPVLGGGVF